MENLEDVVKHRLNKSDEALQEAQVLAKMDHYNTAVSRLYYAVFYSVSALLLKDKIYSKSHTGLKSKFHEHIMKELKLGAKVAKIYQELFEYRQDADYADFIVFAKEEFEPLFERAQTFIKEIKTLI